MRTRARPIVTCLLSLAVLAGASSSSAATRRARPAAPPTPALTAMRSWASPTSTRVVFDFNTTVSSAIPDSGISRQVVIALPEPGLRLASGVPRIFGVRDGVVDSVISERAETGIRLTLWFRDTTAFHVFTLSAAEDKPCRLVVDVARRGGEAAEDTKLAGIAAAKRTERVRIVAVDAGHGGEDTGARGPGGVLEKTVVLAIARALVDELDQIDGVRAVLTRDGDYFVPLRERYKIAEKMKADIFVSIHANSSKRRGSGRGSEVYFLSLKGASDQADADFADAENAADLVGGVSSEGGSDLVDILYDVGRTSVMRQSQELAASLLDHMTEDRRLDAHGTGVRQAGFVVLKSVKFPSVLVETAFINNPVEARLLKDKGFQLAMGRQLSAGVMAYFRRIGRGPGDSPSDGAGKGSGR